MPSACRNLLNLAALICVTPGSAALAQERSLAELQRDFAMRYMEPDAHTALAKYHHAHGNRLIAFYILETARRGRFDKNTFNRAFASTFSDNPFPIDSPEEEARLKTQAAGAGKDRLAAIWKLADLYVGREDWDNAQKLLRQAIELAPDDYAHVNALAEVLRRQRKSTEADAVIRSFMDSHPESVDEYLHRISAAMESNPAQAKTLLAAAIKKHPKEGLFHFNLGVIKQKEKDDKAAEKEFVEAARLGPDSAYIQGWVGRFFLKVRKDNEKALELYLNAYFLDPHFYDSEYAEGRIRGLNMEIASAEFKEQQKLGKGLKELIEDKNPVVVHLAIDEMLKQWNADFVAPLIQAMENDDGNVRWAATDALMKKVDRKFDDRLRQLLTDTDLRKRGLAAYIAVHLWKADAFEDVTKLLADEAQLVRYDALSALIQEGSDAARKIVRAHGQNETNPGLRRIIESVEKR